MQETPNIQPQEFKIAPEYRRSAVYVLIGLCLIVACRKLLPLYEGISFSWAAIVVVSVITAAMFRWRLRIDDKGIYRRRFLKWDFWPWEGFRSGEFVPSKHQFSTFTRETGNLLNRGLCVEFLKQDESEQLKELCLAMCPFPVQPEIPDEMTLKVGPFKKTYRFSNESILCLKTGRTYSWNDVTECRVKKEHHKRNDFEDICLSLPDVEITLRIVRQNGLANNLWDGPPANIVLRYLLTHVPEEKVTVLAMNGPPASTEELDERLKVIEISEEEYLRPLKKILSICTSVILIVFFLSCWRGVSLVIFLPIAFYVPICYFMHRERMKGFSRKMDKVEQWRERMLEDAQAGLEASADRKGFSSVD